MDLNLPNCLTVSSATIFIFALVSSIELKIRFFRSTAVGIMVLSSKTISKKICITSLYLISSVANVLIHLFTSPLRFRMAIQEQFKGLVFLRITTKALLIFESQSKMLLNVRRYERYIVNASKF